MIGMEKLLLYVSVVMLFPAIVLAVASEVREPEMLGWKASFFALFSFVAFASQRARAVEFRVKKLEQSNSVRSESDREEE